MCLHQRVGEVFWKNLETAGTPLPTGLANVALECKHSRVFKIYLLAALIGGFFFIFLRDTTKTRKFRGISLTSPNPN